MEALHPVREQGAREITALTPVKGGAMIAEGVKTYHNYIGGEWEGRATASLETYDPGNGELVYRPNSPVEDARDAIAAAKHAMETLDWADNPRVRATALYKLAEAEGQRGLAGAPADPRGRQAALRSPRRRCSAAPRRRVLRRPGAQRRRPLHHAGPGLAGDPDARADRRGLDHRALEHGALAAHPPAGAGAGRGQRHRDQAIQATPGATAEFVKMIDDIPEFPKGIVNFVIGPRGRLGAGARAREAPRRRHGRLHRRHQHR